MVQFNEDFCLVIIVNIVDKNLEMFVYNVYFMFLYEFHFDVTNDF